MQREVRAAQRVNRAEPEPLDRDFKPAAHPTQDLVLNLRQIFPKAIAPAQGIWIKLARSFFSGKLDFSYFAIRE
jgi:hypothetical protein